MVSWNASLPINTRITEPIPMLNQLHQIWIPKMPQPFMPRYQIFINLAD
jgi:hypothetical protein